MCHGWRLEEFVYTLEPEAIVKPFVVVVVVLFYVFKRPKAA